MSLRTVFEVVTLTEVEGFGTFAEPVVRYDELQSDQALREFELSSSRGKSTVGQERSLTTHGGAEIRGRVTLSSVELWHYKTNGAGWNSERKIFGADPASRSEGMRSVVIADG